MHGQAIKFLCFSLITSFAFIVAVFFAHEAFAQGTDRGVDIGGWAWNSLMGWVTQRDVITDPKSPGQRKGTFGVVKYDKGQDGKEKSGEDFIEGWSWSSVHGFICWGATCETLCTREQRGTSACALSPDEKSDLSGSIDPPDSSTKPLATITKEKIGVKDPRKGKIETKKLNVVKGWAKVLSMKDQGWISLSGCTAALNKGACPEGKEYGVYFDPDTQEFRGWAWSSLFGWLAFSGKTLYDTAYEFVENSRTKERFEVRDDPVLGKVVAKPDSIVKLDIFLKDIENKYFEYKSKDEGRACLTTGLCEDVGFSEKIGKSAWRTQYVGPWVQTKGGTAKQTNIGTTIFSREGFDITTSPGFVAEQVFTGEFFEKNNGVETGKKVKGKLGSIAAGCDTSDRKCSAVGKKRSISEQPVGGKLDEREGALLLEFPKKSSKDKQKLVSNLSTLQKKVFTTLPVGGEVKNAYGYKVKKITSEQDILDVVTAGLKDTIYLYDVSRDPNPKTLMIGSETLRTGIQFNNGRPSGAGTIVAYGADIKIYRPLTYEKSAVNNLKHLASIAWIALKDDDGKKEEEGNIIFDDCIPPQSTVKMHSVPLAGLFFAEGEIRTGHGDGQKCLDAFAKSPYDLLPVNERDLLQKAFKGGFSALDAPITVEGIMVAAKFVLQRVFGGIDQGSELILDTGRAHTNPPPGIEDIIRSLPFK